MVKYRRYYVPAAIYFFTVTLSNRRLDYLTKYIKELTAAINHVRGIHPFNTLAMVVLPDHLHAMWQLPDDDSNYSVRWRFIKMHFARNLKKIGVRIEKNIYGDHTLWQRRFWEHVIRNEIDYAKHVDYIHFNPVKHKYVERVADWPYSTFHKYVKQGLLPSDWCYQNEDMNVE